MTNVSEIKNPYIVDAENLLRDALGQKFQFVVIVGVNDKGVWFRKSKDCDTLKVLGALEHAKHQTMEKWT